MVFVVAAHGYGHCENIHIRSRRCEGVDGHDRRREDIVIVTREFKVIVVAVEFTVVIVAVRVLAVVALRVLAVVALRVLAVVAVRMFAVVFVRCSWSVAIAVVITD